MCVKEFFGYKCGHCSIPTLRQCPISASNPSFPICDYPAERPVFTDGYCHPCFRVLWNARVLEEEESHKQLHLRGQCNCGTIFEEEGLEKRVRFMVGNGKGKEVAENDYVGQEMEASSIHAGHGAGERNGAGGQIYGGEHAFTDKRSINTAGAQNRGWSGTDPRDEQDMEAREAAYKYVGYIIGNKSTHGYDKVEWFAGQPLPGYGGPSQSFATAGSAQHHSADMGHLTMHQNGLGMKWNTENITPIVQSGIPEPSYQSAADTQWNAEHKLLALAGGRGTEKYRRASQGSTARTLRARPHRTQSESDREDRYKDVFPELEEEPEIPN